MYVRDRRGVAFTIHGRAGRRRLKLLPAVLALACFSPWRLARAWTPPEPVDIDEKRVQFVNRYHFQGHALTVRTPADELRHPWPAPHHDPLSPGPPRAHSIYGARPLPHWHWAVSPPVVQHVKLLKLPDHPLHAPRETWAYITLQHEDAGDDHFLDRVDLRDDRGRLIVRLSVENRHPHGLGGEPFTVLARNLYIPSDARTMTVTAFDTADSRGLDAVTIDLAKKSGPRWEIEGYDPYPITGRPMAARRYFRSVEAAELVDTSW